MREYNLFPKIKKTILDNRSGINRYASRYSNKSNKLSISKPSTFKKDLDIKNKSGL